MYVLLTLCKHTDLPLLLVWVTKILKVFGIIPDAEFGFEEATGGAVGGESRHAVLAPLVGAIAQVTKADMTGNERST